MVPLLFLPKHNTILQRTFLYVQGKAVEASPKARHAVSISVCMYPALVRVGRTAFVREEYAQPSVQSASSVHTTPTCASYSSTTSSTNVRCAAESRKCAPNRKHKLPTCSITRAWRCICYHQATMAKQYSNRVVSTCWHVAAAPVSLYSPKIGESTEEDAVPRCSTHPAQSRQAGRGRWLLSANGRKKYASFSFPPSHTLLLL